MSKTMCLVALIASIGTVMIASVGHRPAAYEENAMKQSVTYSYLLKKTPFFTRLDKKQLKWVIKHSTEWEVQAGTVISDSANARDYIWILLDGGWQLQQSGRVQKAGHADPAKWYGAPAAALLPSDSQLIASQHSYVMQIRRADFEKMIARNFQVAHHLAEGNAFYQSLR